MLPLPAFRHREALLFVLVCTACAAAERPRPAYGWHGEGLPFQVDARVTVEFDKPEYFLGENVLVRYCLENTGAETFRICMGGDYQGPRAIRFQVTGRGADGKAVEDPTPDPWCMGGMEAPEEVAPGKRFTALLALSRYLRFREPGDYTVRIVHDLGWKLTGDQKPPAGEARIKFVMPSPEQARKVVAEMRNLPKDAGAGGMMEKAQSRNFACLWYPVYLPILLEDAQRGDEDALTGIGQMPTPEATEALIGLLDHQDHAFVLKVAKMLNERLPDPVFDGKPLVWYHAAMDPLPKFLRAGWRDEFAPRIAAHAREMLTWDGGQAKECAGLLLISLASKDDLPSLTKALDWMATDTEGSLRKEYGILERGGACSALQRSAIVLVKRGVDVNSQPRSPGEAVLFLLALGNREDFRPQGWEATATRLLQHEIPFVRQLALTSLPRPLAPIFADRLLGLLADADMVVQDRACRAAVQTKDPRCLPALLKIVSSTSDRWLLSDAHSAATACGGRADSLALLAKGIGGADLGWERFSMLVSAVMKSRDGGGSNKLEAVVAAQLRERWAKFIEEHRKALQEGRRYEIGDPELTPDLMPATYKLRRADGTDWP